MHLALFVAIYCVGLITDYFLLRKKIAKPLCALNAVVFLPLPYLIPEELILVRFYASVLVLLKLIRNFEFAFGHVVDSKMLQPFSRFVVWSLAHGDASWPKDDKERRRNVGFAWDLLKEGTLYFVLLGIFIAAILHLPQTPKNPYIVCLVLLIVMGLLAPAATAYINGLTILVTKVHVTRAMNQPLLSKSMRDFWGKRWNLAFRDWAHRSLFSPMIKNDVPPTLALLTTFAVSAAMHEYLVVICLGGTNGKMGAFFIIHGLICIIEYWLWQKVMVFKHPIVDFVWTWTLFIATAPLFFDSFLHLVPFLKISR